MTDDDIRGGAGEDEGVAQAPEEPGSACDERIEALERERDEYLELARRARADYVNLQRRMETQSESIRDAARHEFARDMLTVLDDLDLAIKHVKEADAHDHSGVLGGIELVRAKFIAILGRYGIKPIEAEGMPFDHNLHEAIAEHETSDVAAGTVYAVAQAGYTAQGRLLRPSKVIVAKEPA